VLFAKTENAVVAAARDVPQKDAIELMIDVVAHYAQHGGIRHIMQRLGDSGWAKSLAWIGGGSSKPQTSRFNVDFC